MGSSDDGARKRKRLLVAAVGVATISYTSSQGCERESITTTTSGNLVPPPADAGRVQDAAVLDGSAPSGESSPPRPKTP